MLVVLLSISEFVFVWEGGGGEEAVLADERFKYMPAEAASFTVNPRICLLCGDDS